MTMVISGDLTFWNGLRSAHGLPPLGSTRPPAATLTAPPAAAFGEAPGRMQKLQSSPTWAKKLPTREWFRAHPSPVPAEYGHCATHRLASPCWQTRLDDAFVFFTALIGKHHTRAPAAVRTRAVEERVARGIRG